MAENRFNCSVFHYQTQLTTMKFATTSARYLTLAVLLGAGTLACQNDDNTTPAPDVALATTSLGTILTGDGGKTLYVFSPDVGGNSTCSGQCKTNWPVFFKETLTVGNGLKAADFTTITRTDGEKQTAYKGWPLYYFANDAQSGDVKGENVNERWFVARPNYTLLIAAGQLKGLDGKNYTSDYKEGTGNTLYFTDSTGRTLYAFAPDKKNKNTYTKADLSNNATWPLFEASLTEIPSTLNKADFSVITVAGRKQLTYKGWPLYYFDSDQNQRGSTKGVSVPRPGVWPVVYKTIPEAPLN
ncbi:hypothetical protein DYU11_16100 [Fibrisoma montanum]|uniref:Secreted repeat protein with Y-X4-D motif n=2 Tax=Fibrisoma montanum TaxID=2305895 RepID=A0A418M8W7_9BACT|nr:hypothetical protein DYU11_16100 [Fibrisoma montanum]